MTGTRDDSTGGAAATPELDARRPAHRDAPLAMDRETFRAAAHELVDLVADRLARVPAGPVTRGESPEAIRALIDAAAPLPARGTEARTLLRDATELLFEHSLFNGHPRFFGYITAAPAPIGILGDFLAAAVNANVGAWRLSPVATEIEAQTIRWIAELVGYPGDGGGLLVSGGNMANTVALFAARAAAADWDLRKTGVGAPHAPRLCVYASAETHTWIQKATDLAGLGTDAIRWIPTDADQRLDLEALRQAIAADRAAGHRPMMVVGTAGSVSTGVVDPLIEYRRAVPGGRGVVPHRRGVRRLRGGRARDLGRPGRARPGRLDRPRSTQVAVRAARGRLRPRP